MNFSAGWKKGALVIMAGAMLAACALWGASYVRPWTWVGEHGGYTYSVTNRAGGVEVVRFAREAEEEEYAAWRVRYWMVVVGAAVPAAMGVAWWTSAGRSRGRGFPVEA